MIAVSYIIGKVFESSFRDHLLCYLTQVPVCGGLPRQQPPRAGPGGGGCCVCAAEQAPPHGGGGEGVALRPAAENRTARSLSRHFRGAPLIASKTMLWLTNFSMNFSSKSNPSKACKMSLIFFFFFFLREFFFLKLNVGLSFTA